MVRLGLSVILAFVLHGCASVVQEEDVVGTYKLCLMACTTIEIRPDRTFHYTAMTDVGSPPEIEGTWRILENGLIEAESYDQPTGFPHEETFDPSVEGVVVRVLEDNEPLLFADVMVVYVDGRREEANTEELPELRFPPGNVKQIRVEPGMLDQGFMGAYNGAVYEVGDPNSNTFELSITWVPFYLKDLWLIQNRKLYTVEHFPLKKAN